MAGSSTPEAPEKKAAPTLMDGLVGDHQLSAEDRRKLAADNYLEYHWAVVKGVLKPTQAFPRTSPGLDSCAAVLVNHGICVNFLTEHFKLKDELLNANRGSRMK